MQAGNARIGRTILAALTGAVLMLSMVTLFANPADASGEGVCWNVDDGPWRGVTPGQVLLSEPIPSALQGKEATVTFTSLNQSSTHDTDVRISTGDDSFVVSDVEATPHSSVTDSSVMTLGSDITLSVESTDGTISMEFEVCVEPLPEKETTTTTTEATTTTTVEETTTVPEETTTTTTTEVTTTTTEETTTTIPDEVQALVFVTVEERCVVDDNKGEGEITVTVSVDDAATVVIRNSDGAVVASVTDDAVVTVPEGATYTWEATPNEGFEFAEDFVSSDEIEIETCTPDEVKDLEVLPFTGAGTEALAVIAAVLSAIGLLVILATRRVEE